jgi:hypothetical protein
MFVIHIKKSNRKKFSLARFKQTNLYFEVQVKHLSLFFIIIIYEIIFSFSSNFFLSFLLDVLKKSNKNSNLNQQKMEKQT